LLHKHSNSKITSPRIGNTNQILTTKNVPAVSQNHSKEGSHSCRNVKQKL